MATNLLELVPAFRRQIGLYINEEDTDSKLAAYLADAVQALMFRWERTYSITFTPPHTYIVEEDIAEKDYRPIVLAASIIYKGATQTLAAFQDGDFSYNPRRGTANTIDLDREELNSYLPSGVRLARPVTAPLRGYANVFNRESYIWLLGLL